MKLQEIILSTILLFAGCNETLKNENNKNPIYQKPIPQNPAPTPEKAPIIEKNPIPQKAPIIVNYAIPVEKPREPIKLNIGNTRYSFIPARDKLESNVLNIYDANGILKEKIYDFDRNGKIGDFFDSYTTFEGKDTETFYSTSYILHKAPNYKDWKFIENPTKADLKPAFDKANIKYSMFLKMKEEKENLN